MVLLPLRERERRLLVAEQGSLGARKKCEISLQRKRKELGGFRGSEQWLRGTKLD